MRYPLKWTALLICLCTATSGCATMRYPSAYKVEGKEFKNFKDLNDDQAVKLVALIYNVDPDCWEDEIARSISLEEYIELLSKRNSKYVKDSGIFEIKYDKATISTWKDEDLIKLYDCLAPKAGAYYAERAPELSETQNAQRIIYLTSVNAVVKELKKRDIARKALDFTGQVIFTALSVALSMI